MPDRILYEDNISNLGVKNDGNLEPIVADRKYNQSLSYLWLWDDANQQWVRALSDEDGRILVSTTATKAENGVSSAPAMSTTSATVIASNPDRNEVWIQNKMGVSVFLSFDGDAATTSDFELEDGQTLIVDSMYGLITGILAAGSGNLKVTEFS